MIRDVESDCSFTLEDAMTVDDTGRWVIQLEVRDDKDHTATDTVAVTVK